MGVQLRVVLDQLAQVIAPDLASASSDLAAGLVATAPSGCGVDAIVPSGSTVEIPGLGEVKSMALPRRELAASWQLGIAPGVGGGMIHSPSLMAPLVRHDRVHDPDQTVVTLWDLSAWEAPHSMPKPAASWQRAMLRRAAKHADALVVPSHAFVERVEDLARFGDRIRVIAGAPPSGLESRSAESAGEYLVLFGPLDTLEHGFRAAVAAGKDVVVIDAAEGAEPTIIDTASAAGLPERRVSVRGTVADAERAGLLAGAAAVVSTSGVTAWPWRLVEALALGAPVVAIDTGVHRDVIAEGGALVPVEEMSDAVIDAVGAGNARSRVLASDRARAFSWASSAERVWALHADL